MSRITLYTSSCVDLIEKVEHESVDLILTDPPYPREFLHCWSELAQFGAHALRPGGSLVTMAPHTHLDTIMGCMDVFGLRYHWIGAYSFPPGSGETHIRVKRVICQWKPILWYVKPPFSIGGKMVRDHIRTSDDKRNVRYHKWGQDVIGMMRLLEEFNYEVETVCDPFLGGGTTALVCDLLGYDFIGADIDPGSIETTRSRLKHDGVQNNMI